MNAEQQALWGKIKEFVMDDPGADFSFTDRLARENAWSLEYAARVVLEYKKFIFLICLSRHPLTPSDQVDQVWHLHLIYTTSYWEDFCKNTLGKYIQHGPTRGGEGEKQKFDRWYAATKKLYRDTFGQAPPPDIWPSSDVRFGEINFSRINLDRNWVIPKIRLLKIWRSCIN